MRKLWSIHPSIHFHCLYSPLFTLLSTHYSLPPLLCPTSTPLIAALLSLPSNSSPSTSYRSDLMFISALFSLRSPVPLRLLPAVFVHCGPRAKDEMTLTAETQPPIFLSISHAITCLHFSPVFKSAFVCLDAFMGRAVRLLSFFPEHLLSRFPTFIEFWLQEGLWSSFVSTCFTASLFLWKRLRGAHTRVDLCNSIFLFCFVCFFKIYVIFLSFLVISLVLQPHTEATLIYSRSESGMR